MIVKVQRKCIQCGDDFHLEKTEIEFYKKNKLSLPKRCKSCRKKNKQIKYKAKQNIDENQTELEEENGQAIAATQKVCNDTITMDMPIKKQEIKKTRIYRRLFKVISLLLVLLGIGIFGRKVADNDYQPDKNQNKDLSAIESNATLSFRNNQLCSEHFEKHKLEFTYNTIEEYVKGANRVIASADALHKLEEEDGDDIYYLESTNEIVIVSPDGFIRTYFKPDSGIDYYNKQ